MVEVAYPCMNVRDFMTGHPDAVKSVDSDYVFTYDVDTQQVAPIEDLPQIRSKVYRSGDYSCVPVVAVRRDCEVLDRINAPTIERPSLTRHQGHVPDVDLCYVAEHIVPSKGH